MRFEDLFGKARFIAPSDSSVEAPYIRTTFTAGKVTEGKITICGLGFFELYINGKRVGDDYFVPACSMFQKRGSTGKLPCKDVFSGYHTYALSYDVLPFIKSGVNTLVVLLGNGWYGDTGDHDTGSDYYGKVKLAYKLDFTDETGTHTVVSDEKHKWKQSYILDNHLYLGEKQDMRLYDETIFDAGYMEDASWRNVVRAEIHESEYEIQCFPTDKEIARYTPTLVKDFGAYKVYDCGVNLTGFVIMMCGKAGEEITVEHAEELHEDKTLDVVTCAGDRKPVIDRYIADGKHEMQPHFCWHGFRYFSVKGNAEPVCAVMVHTSAAVTSSFESDNGALNWLYETYLRTQLENMHAGIPSDCPTRERLGYTGDGQLCAESAMLMLDGKEFYRKWMKDIADSQCRVSGHVPHTAPYLCSGGGTGGWGCAIVHVPYVYYKIYGDDSLIRTYFDRMVAYIGYMDSRSRGGFVTYEEDGCWNLGDWGFSKQDEFVIPQSYVNTYFYVKSLQEMCEMAPLCGFADMVPSFEEKIRISKTAMHGAYFTSQDGNFFGDYQGANVFAVSLGIGDERTYRNLREKYLQKPEYDTGIFATELLTRLLFEKGDAETAVSLITGEGELSFGNMRCGGATTLWEYFCGILAAQMSHNHPMFGALTHTLFDGLLGIRQTEASAGFAEVILDPAVVSSVGRCKGSILTPYGKLAVGYEKEDGTVCCTAEIPTGIRAFRRAKDGTLVELAAGSNKWYR